jgi:glycosyltransferase involved in cell wall biosynthesis
MSLLSVIICTHNPRPYYLKRVLDSLAAQTLPRAQWELLLVDNASSARLSESWDLTWHPHGRHLHEAELGLTPARVHGIRKAGGELIVFVDDDNVLAPDYLMQAQGISAQHPFLGAWGAGVIEPEFESPAPGWLAKYFYLIALKNVRRDCWSNLTENDLTLPCGAGLCVRRNIAQGYVQALEANPNRRKLDRIGAALGCSGDLDLALTATDFGLGTGLFTGLKMTHLMPASRLQEDYLLRIAEGNSYSGLILAASRGRLPGIPKLSGLRSMLGKARRFLTMKSRDRRFFEAGIRGQQRALSDLQTLTNKAGGNPKWES